MTELSQRTDVAILGGGMVGMTLGVALAQAGISAAIIERLPFAGQLDAQFDGRVSAIALGSQRLLERIGAWAFMAEHAQPIYDIRVSDNHSPFFLHYTHREVGEAVFGYIVENRHIRHALQQAAARQPRLSLLGESGLARCERAAARVELELENGDRWHSQLIVGADGKQSALRKLAGIAAFEHAYQQTAIVCTIDHELPHDGLAQERFLPAGPFAVLPMRGNRSSLVWVEPSERAGLYLNLAAEEFAQEIRERVGEYLGVITPTGPRFAYPLSLMHASSYIGHRLALIGDAAHAIHPIAGQGVNLGFRDAAVLAELVADRAALGLDVGSADVLRHYQQWRRLDNLTMLGVTDGLNRLFSNALPPVKLARGLGLWGVGRLPAAKRFFMRQAMGLAGDVPRLMRA